MKFKNYVFASEMLCNVWHFGGTVLSSKASMGIFDVLTCKTGSSRKKRRFHMQLGSTKDWLEL